MSGADRCQCIALSEQADSVFVKHNTKLGTVLSLKGGPTRVEIATYLIEKRRGAHPINIVANYCPFCGTRYEAPDEDVEAQP